MGIVTYTFTSFATLLMTRSFLAIFFSFFVSHLLKVFVDWYEQKKFSLKSFYRTGGMPSAHTATVVAIVMSVFFVEGVSMLFIAVLFFSLIIVRDALGVRFSVGQQAQTLNKLLKVSGVEESVKVILGHTLSQVVVGALIGTIVTFVVFII